MMTHPLVQAAALADTVAELRDALDRQRKAAELRDEMLRQDVKVRCSWHASLRRSRPDWARQAPNLSVSHGAVGAVRGSHEAG